MLKVNPKCEVQVEFIGKSRTPIMIIDNYADNLEEIISYAKNHEDFSPDGLSYYPGIRAKLSKDYVINTLKPLLPYLTKLYKVPQNYTPQPKENYFSLITTPPDELTELQTIPHIDGINPMRIAAIHYLGAGDFGSTGFYRIKSSKDEAINSDRENFYLHTVQEYLKTTENQKRSYCGEENSAFMCYKKVDYKSNRLLLFPGYLLHSSLVNVDRDLNSDPTSGRLTANMFIDFN